MKIILLLIGTVFAITSADERGKPQKEFTAHGRAEEKETDGPNPNLRPVLKLDTGRVLIRPVVLAVDLKRSTARIRHVNGIATVKLSDLPDSWGFVRKKAARDALKKMERLEKVIAKRKGAR